ASCARAPRGTCAWSLRKRHPACRRNSCRQHRRRDRAIASGAARATMGSCDGANAWSPASGRCSWRWPPAVSRRFSSCTEAERWRVLSTLMWCPPTSRWRRSAPACRRGTGRGGFAISMDATGHVEFSALGGGSDPEAADAYTAAINSCMTGFTFESAPFAYRDVVSSSVDRLIAYDYAWRWMLPCLAGHDRLPSHIPSFSDFAQPEGAPWSNYYSPTSRDDFDELLEVRYT